MNALIQAGYPYELAGLLYYVFFVLMTRGKAAARFSQRSRVLTLAASIALIGSVPLHYAAQPAGVALMLGLVVVAMASTWLDRGRAQPPPATAPRVRPPRAKAPPGGRRHGKRQPKATSSSRLPSGSSKKQA
jgi:hypothetical protein